MLWRCSDCAFVSVAAGGHRSSASQGCCRRHPALIPATHRPAPLLMSVEFTFVFVCRPAARALEAEGRQLAPSIRHFVAGKGTHPKYTIAPVCTLPPLEREPPKPTQYHEHLRRQSLPLVLAILNRLPVQPLSYRISCLETVASPFLHLSTTSRQRT
jgi:hypothetical protein